MSRFYHVLASDTLKMRLVPRLVNLVIAHFRLILPQKLPGLRVLTIYIVLVANIIVWRHWAKFIGKIFAGVSALVWLVWHLRLLSLFTKKFLILCDL